MERSLSGLLVVSIEQAVAAPLCTARLAEACARVIKVERIEGDFARNYDNVVKGESSYFTWLNQGKESIVLDFKKKDDRDLINSIIKKADVFVQNLKPNSLRKYQLNSESLRGRHPNLITCDISGYGEEEKLRNYKAYDLLVQAESGLVGISGSPDEYGRIGVSICDIGAGITSYAAVLEGLVRKYRGLGGSSFKTSLFRVAAEWMTVPLAQYEYGMKDIKPAGLKHPTIAPYGAFYTKDKKLIIISIQNEREWEVFCKNILKCDRMYSDKNFATNSARVRNRSKLDNAIQSKLSNIASKSLEHKLEMNSIAFGKVNDLATLANHFSLNRQFMCTTSNQKVSFPASPIERFFGNENLKNKQHRTPRLGENTKAIKSEFSIRK